MAERDTIRRARRDRSEGKAPSTQAGEFVREEIEHVRQGKHGARSTKQAIAIGLSKARRSGVGVFSRSDPRAIARSLKRSAEQSHRRKSEPFRSAMSMLSFYIDRAGRQLSASQRNRLERAKDELRDLYGRPRRKKRSRS